MLDIFVIDLESQENLYNLGEPVNSNLDDFSSSISSQETSEGFKQQSDRFLETDSLGYYEKEIRRDAIYPIEAKHIQYTITNQVL